MWTVEKERLNHRRRQWEHNRNAMTMQYLPNSAGGKTQLMKAQQLALQAFGLHMALAAHVQDEGLVLCREGRSRSL